MRRAELMLTQVQRATENERVGSNDGISTEEYYQYFSDAVKCLQRNIMKVNNKVFRAEAAVFSASGAEEYDLPADIFARNQVVALEYSASGATADYKPLIQVTQLERRSVEGYPTRYLIRGKKVLVNAYPAAGSFRMTYAARLPSIDKRRATVASKTTAGGAITALSLTGFTAADSAYADHLTIVDFNGNVKMRGIPYTSITAGVVAIQGSSYTYPEGSTIAVGDYVCLGEYASTHVLFDDQCEDFVLTYCEKRILNRDSSSDAVERSAEVIQMIQDIVDIYAEDADVNQVPILNGDYFDDLD
jgi:hypothetical protein